MGQRWTEDQLKAIEMRDQNILVSAAAGSGKTALLIERIIRLILNENTDISQILVLTFTRAAAGEMKDRLKKRLNEALSLRTTEPSRILNQIHSLSTASISTLDSFCTSFLRENFQVADVDPNFSIGQEGQLNIIRASVLESVLESYYQSIPENAQTDFSRLADMFSDIRGDEKLKQIIIRFHNFLATIPDPETWCEKAISQYDLLKTDDETVFFSTNMGKTGFRYFQYGCHSAITLLSEALKIAETDSAFEKISLLLEMELTQVQSLSEAFSGGLKNFYIFLDQLQFSRFPILKKLTELQKEQKEQIKNLRDEAKEIITQIQKTACGPFATMAEALQEMKPHVVTLIKLTKNFSEAYYLRKTEEGLLDFNDVERLTLQALKKNPALCTVLRQRYAYVFLDEYQDTNAMQEAIIQCILRDNNYFMVGDVKQSIYRFRLADPSIFISKYHAFGLENENEQKKNQLITLRQNFRSSLGVIQSVNAVFEQIMTTQLGEIEYDDKARLYPGLLLLNSVDDTDRTEIHCVINRASENPEKEEAELLKISDTEKEALHIAEQITKMVGQCYVSPVTGETRVLRYRDIGILMRAVSGRSRVFERVFKEAGIPLFFEGGSAYYETPEISLILNLLRLIDNRFQDLPLIAVLFSPILNFTVEECSQIRVEVPESHYFHQAFWRYPEISDSSDPLGQRIQKFGDRLSQWRFEVGSMGIEAFLWKLYRDTGYYTFVGGLTGGEQRQSNLRQLLSKAADYKRATLKGLFQFVRYVDQMKRQKIDDIPPGILDENDDVVRMMTIHKSKGLEFPVVFVAGLGRQFTKDPTEKVVFHKDLGVCFQCVRPEKHQYFPTLFSNLAQETRKIEALSEEMRLLYVAMTRAQEKLFLVGTVKEKFFDHRKAFWTKPNEPYWLQKAECLLDWVMLAERGAKTAFITRFITEETQVNGLKHDEGLSSAPIEEEIEPTPWFYPYGIFDSLPEKMTVSELNRLANQRQVQPIDFSGLALRPRFMQVSGQSAFSAAERGTGIHAVLNDIDLNVLRSSHDLNQAVFEHGRRMVAQHKLLPSLMEVLDLNMISDFFVSDLGQRLICADLVWREKPFNFQVDAGRYLPQWQGKHQVITIQGMIDCCFLSENGWVLLDYKTDQYSNSEEGQVLAEHYLRQIQLYGEALSVLTGTPVAEAYLVLLAHGDILKIAL